MTARRLVMPPTTPGPIRRLLSCLACLAVGVLLAQQANAAAAPLPGPATPLGSATATSPPLTPYNERQQRMSFRELGAIFPLQLRGIDGRNGVPFSTRADEVVVRARLHLEYAYSPALLPEISHLNVLVNEQVIRSLPVPTSGAGITHQVDIDIPAALITEYNRLNVQLIGHYTLECEDPLHSSLWAVVSNNSWIELTVSPLRLENDLALLPLPFFDRRSPFTLELPFVFAQAPDATLTEAAAALSSWFGAQASYRGAHFPVQLGQLPTQGNAVIVATATSRVPGVSLPEISGPTLALINHPTDPFGKLLLVLGRDAAEAKLAAQALTIGNQALKGSRVTVREFAELAPRRPYDAPNWLPTDRPVRFGELVDVRDLTVSGYSPDLIRIPLRLPPDLFGWRERGVPVDLRYRYTPRPYRDQSTLNVNVGPTFLRSIPIPSDPQAAPNAFERIALGMVQRPGGGASQKFYVPLFMLPSQTQLLFHYYYEAVKERECAGVLVDNVRGSIDADSTIDISGLQHYMEMPNLAAFATSGFPFTRMADLSETVVVMPNNPGADDYTALLGLMGRMGDSTGYPAIRVSVAFGNDPSAMLDKDILLLSSGANQPLLRDWQDRIPFSLDGDQKRYTLADRVFRLFARLSPGTPPAPPTQRAELLIESPSTDAVIAGFESPISAKRSVVLLASSQPGGLARGVAQFSNPDSTVDEDIQGSFAVIRGTSASALAADQSYSVGRLDPITALQYYLAYRPVFLVILGILGILILASFFFLSLRARARKRLNP